VPAANENRLREEEIIGGFEPNTSDDESFLVEVYGEYPGILPDFGEEPEDEPIAEVIADTASEPQTEINTEVNDNAVATEEAIDLSSIDEFFANKNTTNDENVASVWDNFDNDSSEQSVIEQQDINDSDNVSDAIDISVSGDISAPEDMIQEAADIVPDNIDISIDEPADISPENIIQDDAPANQIADDILESIDFNAVAKPESDELLDIGDDLKQLLAQDLLRSQAKSVSEAANVDEPVDEAVLNERLKSFLPVEDKAETEYIDISALDASSPSIVAARTTPNPEYVDEPVQLPMSEQAQQSAKKEKKPPKPPKLNVPKEKKEHSNKRKKSLWIAASVAILMAIGFGGYYLVSEYGLIDKLTMSGDDSLDTTKVVNEKPAETPTEDKAAALKEPVTQPTETIKPAPIVEESHEQKDLDKSAAKSETKQKPKPQAPQIKKAEKPKRDIAMKNKQETPPAKVKPKLEKPQKKNIAKVEKKEAKTNTKSSKKQAAKDLQSQQDLRFDDHGLYTVEVCSSQSKSEAEAWLKKLEKRNVANAFIKTQLVRNVVVYKVRFGAYSTRQDAASAALKLGLPQVTIDRVR
jgi:hypothetical protein